MYPDGRVGGRLAYARGWRARLSAPSWLPVSCRSSAAAVWRSCSARAVIGATRASICSWRASSFAARASRVRIFRTLRDRITSIRVLHEVEAGDTIGVLAGRHHVHGDGSRLPRGEVLET